ncbi:MBL fold metallo-hydrolase [Pantoea sp. 18069]|uniref:MBL fold metallo-hydrolase n=1 Tax=Pantoea sp. 18069 TaxID=2681415 RepID=UPI0013576C0C|nr:MBL fold metallo-hydrolase [Pantoea sp. 18069]
MARNTLAAASLALLTMVGAQPALAHDAPAQATAAAPVRMQLQPVARNAYYVQGASALGSPANRNFISNAGFVVTDDSVVVIDALGSPALGQELVEQIRAVTAKPISHVIITHYHADHIYGLQVFEALGAKIVANALAREYIQSETARLRLEASRQDLAPWIDGNTRMVPASQWIRAATQTLRIGGTDFVLQHMGPAHAPEDTAVFLPRSGVLFIGDVVFRNRIPYVGQADSRHWIAALDSLLQLPVKVMVPGHGPASTHPKADMQLTRDYLAYLREAMGKAAANLDPFDEAYASTDWSRFAHYPLFKEANRMNAYNTFLLMEQEKP